MSKGRLGKVAYVRLSWVRSLKSYMLPIGGQVDVGNCSSIAHDHITRRRVSSCHQLLLLLGLVARLPYRGLAPAIRVNVDVDDGAASLRCDLVLCPWNRCSILPDSMNLNLELMGLARSIWTSSGP